MIEKAYNAYKKAEHELNSAEKSIIPIQLKLKNLDLSQHSYLPSGAVEDIILTKDQLSKHQKFLEDKQNAFEKAKERLIEIFDKVENKPILLSVDHINAVLITLIDDNGNKRIESSAWGGS